MLGNKLYKLGSQCTKSVSVDSWPTTIVIDSLILYFSSELIRRSIYPIKMCSLGWLGEARLLGREAF